MLGVVQKIGEPCQSQFNAGFLTHLYAIRTDDVAFVATPEAGSIFQPINAMGIQPDSIITEFRIRSKTATFSEGYTENADGEAYSSTLGFPMKGSAADITTWVYQNARRRFILLTRDTLGNCYMAGSFDNGARVSWARQVGSVSIHQLSFALVNWHPIQFIPTVDLEQIFPFREFDYSFDLSFA